MSDAVRDLEQNISCRRLLTLAENSLEQLNNHLINLLRNPKLSHSAKRDAGGDLGVAKQQPHPQNIVV